MRISDWSSDVCSSDLVQSSSSVLRFRSNSQDQLKRNRYYRLVRWMERRLPEQHRYWHALPAVSLLPPICPVESPSARRVIRRQSPFRFSGRSEEHTSELQSLLRISYAVFCLKKKKIIRQNS